MERHQRCPPNHNAAQKIASRLKQFNATIVDSWSRGEINKELVVCLAPLRRAMLKCVLNRSKVG